MSLGHPDDDLLVPEVPIRRVKRRVDPERVERLARRLLEIADREGIRGPAGLMRAMEEDRELVRHLDVQTEVVRKVRAIRRDREWDATESEPVSGERKTPTKRERMEAHIRAALKLNPDATCEEVYELLSEEDRERMSLASFRQCDWNPVTNAIREEKGSLPEPGVSEVATSDDPKRTQGADAPAREPNTGEASSPQSVAPGTEEPTEDGEAEDAGEGEASSGEQDPERSEAAPAPSPFPGEPATVVTGETVIVLGGAAGALRAERSGNGEGAGAWRIEIELETDRETVHRLVDALYPAITGLGEGTCEP